MGLIKAETASLFPVIGASVAEQICPEAME